MSNITLAEWDTYSQDDQSTNQSIIQALQLLLNSSLSVYAYAIIVALCTIVSVNLPIKLIHNDAITRSLVHLVTTLVCAMAGTMLSTAVFTLIPAAFEPAHQFVDQTSEQASDDSFAHLSIQQSKHKSLYVSLALLLGLLNVPIVERCLLYTSIKISNKLSRYRASSESSEYDESSAFLHQNRSASQSSTNRMTSSSLRPSIGSTNYQSSSQSTLLPVPDYRRARDLTQDDPDDFMSFDLDDRDQLSPPLSSSQRQSNQSLYQSTNEYVSIDANSFLETQKYLARCAYCKDKIHTRKGLAYHGAGCELLNVHAFDFNSTFCGSLRGKRSEQAMKHSLTPMISIYISLFNQTINLFVMGMAFINFRDLSLVSSICYLISFMCYTSFLGLCLGLGFQQHRCATMYQVLTSLYVAAVSTASLILAHYLSLDFSTLDIMTSMARAYTAGNLIWVCVVDCVIEEMERRDARATKWPALVICGVGTAAMHWLI